MGQSKKRRPCPAAGRDITAAECGENRQSRYACPESCPFNPYTAAHYDALLAAEDELDALTLKRLIAEAGENSAVRDALLAADRHSSNHGLHAATVWHLFFKRDAEGRTFAARWHEAGFPGLKNDQRVLFARKAQMRVALIEIHRIIDDQWLEAVDLLEPDAPAMLLVDRSMAARAVRFTTFLTWIYPLPHFWRMSGTGIGMTDLGPFTPREMIDECVAHLGGPAEPEPRGRWLAENFVRIDDALAAVGYERRRRTFAEMDAHFGAATYELDAPLAEACAALEADPAIDVDDLQADERKQGIQRAMVWFDEAAPGKSTAPAAVPGRRVLGRILLGADTVKVEALGGARLDKLRDRFEARLGKRVRFVKERRDDLGGQMAAKEPPVEIALVPPRLLEQPTKWDLASSRLAPPPAGVSMAEYQAAFMHEQHRAWIDEALPALDGRTPREAAREPALRSRLVELMKARVRQLDTQNLKTGRTDDINGLVRELGLAEIEFPPPPPRVAPPAEENDEEDNFDEKDDYDDGFDEADDAIVEDRPPAPRLFGEPMSLEQAIGALERVLQSLDTAKVGLDELDASGSTLIEDMAALTEEWMDEREFSIFITFLLQGWFVLVPFGVRAPELDYDAMAATMRDTAVQLQQMEAPAPGAFEKLFGDCRQPALLQALAAGQMAGRQKLPKKLRPSTEAMMGMMLASKALLDELDRVLRA